MELPDRAHAASQLRQLQARNPGTKSSKFIV